MTISVSLERDLEVRVKKFAEGVGVELSDLLEEALKFALKTRFDAATNPDPGYGVEAPVRPDQGLPPSAGTKPVEPDEPDAGTKPVDPDAPRPDNSLPGRVRRCPVFDPTVDNELPEGEIPEEVPEQQPA